MTTKIIANNIVFELSVTMEAMKEIAIKDMDALTYWKDDHGEKTPVFSLMPTTQSSYSASGMTFSSVGRTNNHAQAVFTLPENAPREDDKLKEFVAESYSKFFTYAPVIEEQMTNALEAIAASKVAAMASITIAE